MYIPFQSVTPQISQNTHTHTHKQDLSSVDNDHLEASDGGADVFK